MFPLDPRQGIRELHAAFVVAVEGSEIVAEQEGVWHIQVGLSGNAREAIVAACPLHQSRIHNRRADRFGPRAHESLIAQEPVVSAAGRANSAAIQRIPDQCIQRGRILNRVTDT